MAIAYANRTRRAGLSALLAAMIGLSVGIVLGVASVTHRVLRAPLPYAEPDRLVDLSVDGANVATEVSVPEYRLIQQTLGGLSHVAAYQDWNDTYEDGSSDRLSLASVSPEFFRTLGVSPVLGRLWNGVEQWPTSGIVLSHDYFLRRFGGDPAVIDTTIRLNGRDVPIIGVMPPRFLHVTGKQVDAWTAWVVTESATNRRFRMIGRLKAGMTPQVVQAQLEGHRMFERFRARNLQEAMTRYIENILGVLVAGALTVAMLAFVGASILIGMQTTFRTQERALRVALGAQRFHLLREGAARAAVVALGAAGLACVAAILTDRGLVVKLGGELASGRAPSSYVFLGVLAASLSVAAVYVCHACGGEFRWHAAPARAVRGTAYVKWPLRVSTALQIALSCALVAGSIMASRRLSNFASDSLGFDTRDVVMMHVRIPLAKYQGNAAIDLVNSLLDSLRQHSAVRFAAATNTPPLDDGTAALKATPALRTEAPGNSSSSPWVDTAIVSEDYFSTVGQPLLHGREFRKEDRDRAMVIVSRATATKLWGRTDVVGEYVRLLECGPEFLNVIGVVGDARTAPGSKEQSAAYLPNLRWTRVKINFVMRLARRDAATLSQLQALLKKQEPGLIIDRLAAVDDVRHLRLAIPRVAAVGAAVYASLALLVGALGSWAICILGLCAAKRELSIRAALGASPAHLVGQILRDHISQIVVGAVVGAVLAWAMIARLGPTSMVDPRAAVTMSGLSASFVVLVTVAVIATTASRVLQPLRLQAGQTDS
jgi:putative ABC transport system permease protein